MISSPYRPEYTEATYVLQYDLYTNDISIYAH